MEEESHNQQVEREEEGQREMKPHDETLNEEEQQQNENALLDHTREANQVQKGVLPTDPEHYEEGKVQNEGEVLDEMTYDAGSLKVIFKRRQFSLKITVMTIQGQQKSFQDLLGGKKEECFSVVITRTNMPAFLRKHFKTPANLHTFIVRNIKKEHVVSISKDEVRLVIAADSQQPRVSKIDIKTLREQRYKFEVPNMDDMQDRLLQFTNEELEYIDKYYLISEGQEEPHEEDSEILQWLQFNHESDDEEIFIEKWAPEAFQQEEDAIDMAQIEQQEKEFEEFQKKFPLFKKILQSYTPSQSASHKPNEEKNIASSSSKDSVFPPGYVPPHLAKQTASDGLTSDQHLRFQSNQSKKEKLKIAKQLLKQGYSTAEVIQRLEAMEKSAKSSNTYVDPNPQPSQKPISKPPSAPSVVQPAQAKEKAVREMLISLIRAKTYKRLEDIHKHMMNAGLQTTMGDLKRIIDEIKAKTAQRKAKEGKE